MAIPLHAHPSDGSFYMNCARCRVERTAVELLDELEAIAACKTSMTCMAATGRARSISDVIAKAKGGAK